MLDKASLNKSFIFASRCINDGGSSDDLLLTFIEKKIFTFISKLFFNLKILDILYNYVLVETGKFKKLKLNKSDFRICVEFPIKVKINNFNYQSIGSFERKRPSTIKKSINLLMVF